MPLKQRLNVASRILTINILIVKILTVEIRFKNYGLRNIRYVSRRGWKAELASVAADDAKLNYNGKIMFNKFLDPHRDLDHHRNPAKKFLGPNTDLDEFQNLMVIFLSKDTSSVKFSQSSNQ